MGLRRVTVVRALVHQYLVLLLRELVAVVEGVLVALLQELVALVAAALDKPLEALPP
jgi:hypothetical protein